MRGAVIDALKVTADVGGNLNIESLQDTSSQVSKQNSSGFNASLCIPPICYGVSTVGGSVTAIGAGRNINLGTVTTSRSEDITWDAKNYRRSSQSQEIGSHIAGGDVTLLAGNDESARAATVAADGALSVVAARNVTIDAGRSTQGLDEASYTKSSDVLSSTATTRRDSYRSDTATGSSFGGKSVAVSAGNDIRIAGSEVIADERLALAAANNTTIEASTQTASESHFLDEKKKGVFGSGGIGFTIGSQQQSTDQQTGSTRAAASTVGSVGGDVVIMAGNAYRQTGSDVLAPAGDVTILAKKVDIVEARETSRTDTEQKQRTGGLTIAITAPIVSAVQSLGGTAQAVADTGSKRMKALGAASMAMEAKGIADAVIQSPSQAMGVNLAISIGGSKSQSNSVETSDSARGSSVAAGGNVTIAAQGGGQDSNVTIRGSDIDAGKQAVLMADNRIDILAAQNDWAQHSTNKASAASIGVSFGTSGFLVNASASASKGRSDGTETSYANSHVNAGERVTLVSGGDTTIRGGVITAETVRADIGGNLTIESLLDRAKSDSKQQSAGGSLSVGAGVWSASASMSSAKAKGDYASVTEQSGMRVGDGGFDVNVKGNTDLKGGVISSTQAAIDQSHNSLTTGTLTTSDIENHSSGSAKSNGFGVSSDMFTQGKYGAVKGIVGNALNSGSASGSASGTTRSAVSAGGVVVANDVGQIAATGNSGAETIAALNRDAFNAQNSVQRQDVEAMQKEAQAQQTIKNAAFKQVTVYTDDAYKTMFKKEVKFYRVTCGATQQECMNDASLVKMVEIDPEAAKRDGKVLAVNGIFNTQERAGQLAYQNASVDSKTGGKPSDITLMHIAPADTTLGELMVATYEQKMASTFGYTNADQTYAEALQGRGTESTVSMGHSRGTIVQTNAFNIAAENGYTNPGLVVEGVGMAVPTSTYITSVTNVLGKDGDASNITATYMTNDPVSVIAAGNPGDAMGAIFEFYNVMKTSNSAHSCYGTGAAGCVTIANPVPGGPQPTNQQVNNVQVIRGASQ